MNQNKQQTPNDVTMSSSKKNVSTISWVPPTKRRRTHTDEVEVNYPVKPNTIQLVTKPRTHVNHTYRDFSNVPSPDGMKFEIPHEIIQMPFMVKVYHLLSSNAEISNDSIAWCSHGRAFRITDADFLESSGILHKYFGFNRISKFHKLLSNFGFKQLTQGRDANCYYSEFLLRGLPHLTVYTPEPFDRRRLLPDPDNEPDFYKISELFPLPDDRKDQLEEAKAALSARGIVISNQSDSLSSQSVDMNNAALLSAASRLTNMSGVPNHYDNLQRLYGAIAGHNNQIPIDTAQLLRSNMNHNLNINNQILQSTLDGINQRVPAYMGPSTLNSLGPLPPNGTNDQLRGPLYDQVAALNSYELERRIMVNGLLSNLDNSQQDQLSDQQLQNNTRLEALVNHLSKQQQNRINGNANENLHR